MKNLFLTILITSLFLVACNNKTTKEQDQNRLEAENAAPAAIKENRSIVKAKILSKFSSDGNNFSLKVKILKIYDDGSYPSIAVANQVYELTPNYALDSKGALMKNRKNKGLIELKKVKKGDIVKLEIFFENNKWLINKKLRELK